MLRLLKARRKRLSLAYGASFGLALIIALPPDWASPAQSPQAKKPDGSEKAKAPEVGRLFEQHSKLYGNTRMLAARSGIKLLIVDKQLVLILSAPKWQLTMYNKRVKKYFEVDPVHWQAPSSISVALYRPSDSRALRPVSSKIEDLMGTKTRVYKLMGTVEPPVPGAKHRWSELSLRDGSDWVLDETIVPKAAVQCIEKMFTVPKLGGLPLQLQTHNQRGSTSFEIELKKVSPVTLSAGEFEIPSGFTRARSENELWLDDRTEGVLEMMPSGK